MIIKEIIDNKMPSITEWMEKIDFKNIDEFRKEDNDKRDRLEILHEITGLNYDRPEKLTARDIVDKTPLFTDIYNRWKDEKCALRMVPYNSKLPKLRVRGKTFKENLIWLEQQNISPDDYKAEVIPHNDDTVFSATFLVNDNGIFGEIVPGPHWQLTQGILQYQPVNFIFNGNEWQFDTNEQPIIDIVKDATQKILILDQKTKEQIKGKLNSDFTTEGYIKGYFEFVVWPKEGISFIDYNRVVYKHLAQTPLPILNKKITGVCANPGSAKGIARIINELPANIFNEGDILICSMTMVDHIPLMKKSSAIITEQGTILSHAAIVARELGKPCIIGAKDILTKIKDGDFVFVDTDKGTIEILNNFN